MYTSQNIHKCQPFGDSFFCCPLCLFSHWFPRSSLSLFLLFITQSQKLTTWVFPPAFPFSPSIPIPIPIHSPFSQLRSKRRRFLLPEPAPMDLASNLGGKIEKAEVLSAVEKCVSHSLLLFFFSKRIVIFYFDFAYWNAVVILESCSVRVGNFFCHENANCYSRYLDKIV